MPVLTLKSYLLALQAVQRDIESHNKIVNAVLKLSERLAAQGSEKNETGRKSLKVLKEERERDSLQLVALNLQRRWHGIWLHSLEWQCRLEEALTRRKVSTLSSLEHSLHARALNSNLLRTFFSALLAVLV